MKTPAGYSLEQRQSTLVWRLGLKYNVKGCNDEAQTKWPWMRVLTAHIFCPPLHGCDHHIFWQFLPITSSAKPAMSQDPPSLLPSCMDSALRRLRVEMHRVSRRLARRKSSCRVAGPAAGPVGVPGSRATKSLQICLRGHALVKNLKRNWSNIAISFSTITLETPLDGYAGCKLSCIIFSWSPLLDMYVFLASSLIFVG